MSAPGADPLAAIRQRFVSRSQVRRLIMLDAGSVHDDICAILKQWDTRQSALRAIVAQWRERLFSRPWRPFKATYTVVPQVPSDQILHTAQGFIMHPEMWRRLNAQLVQRPTPEGTQP